MTTDDLHHKLKEAYASQNLNRITVTLINLYKEKISESVEIIIDPDGKYFSKLMMLYHPDRGDFHRNEIDRLAGNQNHDGLLGYAHILMLGRIEEIAATLSSYEDIDYSPVYEWDVNADGFNIVADNNPNRSEKQDHPKKKRHFNFYDAVKIRMYGNIKAEFPSHYLEDIEEFELAQSEINDLDGVQFCIHATSMDLSGNAINDISLLWGLTLLEELDLSDNKLEEIEILVNLRNLKSLNLSNNAVKDISYLLHLPKLEYVDLTGLKVHPSYIRDLEESGVTVMT
jgi:hypothetical protein